jgi:oxygen-independent coproporphyrinogen-3 oxidase
MNNKAGLYIHIPFCKSKCPYCNFYSVKYDKALSEKYTDELIKTMDDYSGVFDTVYFGGGTPSQLDEKDFGKIFD